MRLWKRLLSFIHSFLDFVTRYDLHFVCTFFNIQKEEVSFHQQIGPKLKEETSKCCIWSIALYGAETWTFRKVDEKCLESFEMWCWKRMEKVTESMRTGISYID
jgi:hypothetical protein